MGTRTYADDQAWETSWIPYILPLINAKHFLVKSPIEDDKHRLSDVSMRLDSLHIGIRMRHPGFLEKWPDDVTIRTRRKGYQRVEWDKIMEGEGHLLFVGHANEHWRLFRNIVRWTLLSYPAIKRIYDSGNHPKLVEKPNPDGETWFYALNIREWAKYDSKFVVDANWNRAGFGLEGRMP